MILLFRRGERYILVLFSHCACFALKQIFRAHLFLRCLHRFCSSSHVRSQHAVAVVGWCFAVVKRGSLASPGSCSPFLDIFVLGAEAEFSCPRRGNHQRATRTFVWSLRREERHSL